MTFCFAIADISGVDASGLTRWSYNGQMLDAISGGNTTIDGENVARWLSANGVSAMDQSSTGSQPVDSDSRFPGHAGLVFTDSDNLSYLPPSFQGAILLVVGTNSGSRTLVARDTSQTTTAPAFSVVVDETF